MPDAHWAGGRVSSPATQGQDIAVVDSIIAPNLFCGGSVPTIAASTAAGDAGKFPGRKPFSVLANDQFRAFSTTHVEAWQVRPAIGFACVVPTQIHAPTDRVGAVGLATVWGTAMQCEQSATPDRDGDGIPRWQFGGVDGETATHIVWWSDVFAQRLLVAARIDYQRAIAFVGVDQRDPGGYDQGVIGFG